MSRDSLPLLIRKYPVVYIMQNDVSCFLMDVFLLSF